MKTYNFQLGKFPINIIRQLDGKTVKVKVVDMGMTGCYYGILKTTQKRDTFFVIDRGGNPNHEESDEILLECVTGISVYS